jgi:hypothetical protein
MGLQPQPSFFFGVDSMGLQPQNLYLTGALGDGMYASLSFCVVVRVVLTDPSVISDQSDGQFWEGTQPWG